MEVFVLVGILGTVMLVLGIVGGEVLDGLFDAIGLDAAGGFFSTEAIGGFLAAFGFAGWLLSTSGSSTVVAAMGGGGAGIVMGGIAVWLSRSLMRVSTDASVSADDLRGALGKVITRIPEGGLGEVRISRGGHPMKLSARAEEPLAHGVEIVVVDVISPTQVIVAPYGLDL